MMCACPAAGNERRLLGEARRTGEGEEHGDWDWDDLVALSIIE